MIAMLLPSKLLPSIALLLIFSSKLHGLTFNTSGCGVSKGCFRFPNTCTMSENCDFLITYTANSSTVEFELSGKGNWFAVGFSEDTQMADTDILMCVSADSLSGHYYADSQTTPQITNPTPAAVTIIEQDFDDGVMRCRVLREINPGLTNFKDLNSQLFLMGAYGPLTRDSDQIDQHTVRMPSSNRLSVLETDETTADGSIDKNVLAHGILMTLAWILFAFVGLFTARYMREVWEPTEILGKKAWFTVHRMLMTTAVLLTISGTIVIFVHVKGWSSNAGAHPICGIITIALAVIQPIMAALRPKPDAPKRGIFNWTHRIVGTVALVMAVVSIFLGLDLGQVGLGTRGLHAVITFYIGEFLVFVFEVYLIMSKRNKDKRSVSMTTNGDIAMHSPGTQPSQQSEMSPKEAMIRTMMFVFVTLLGFSVALTIILLLVLKE